jgi:hypothetical protein
MSMSGAIHFGDAVTREPDGAVSGGFATIDGERYAAIGNVDGMPPFLMSIASDSDAWLFIGSNGPFVAGRRSPDTALFPYQTVDKILRHPTTSGARSILLVTRAGRTSLWEPWLDDPAVYRITRNLYKRVDGGGSIPRRLAPAHPAGRRPGDLLALQLPGRRLHAP